MIVFPALLIAGLPPISANATSTLASWPGSIASIGAYRTKLRATPRLCLLFASVSLVGGMIGAMLLLFTPTAIFKQLVPYLLLFATLLFSFSNLLTTRLPIMLAQAGQDAWSSLLKASFVQFFIAIYGGFYGLGISFLLLAALGMLGLKQMHQMNSLKILLMSCIDSSAVVTFLFARVIAWSQAVLMMLGTVSGGYAGAYYAWKLHPQLVRYFVIAIGFGMTSYFFLHG